MLRRRSLSFFFFNDTATTEIYTLSLHDALPIYHSSRLFCAGQRDLGDLDAVTGELQVWMPVNAPMSGVEISPDDRSEEHTSELQSLRHLVCRLLLEKKKQQWAVDIAVQLDEDEP